MNNQEMFDIIWKRAKTPVKALIKFGTEGHARCQYRASEGYKCFIGECIPDEMYKPDMEDYTTFAALTYKFPEIKQLFNNVDRMFFDLIQNIHDIRNETEWNECLINLAKEYKLKVPQ